MRRLLTFAAFLLILSVMPVCAQRGGGHASGGSHGSMGGGHAGFSGHSGFVGHSMGGGSGAHFGSGFASRSGSRFGSGTRFIGGDRFRNGRFGFRNRCIGCFGYPYYGYYGGVDPYWWWDTYPSDDDEQRGHDAEHHGEEHLDRCLLRQFLGQLVALDAHLLCLAPEDGTDRHTEGVGLDERQDERT